MSTVYLDRETMRALNRIADALERIAPPKAQSDGKISVGRASYRYEDPQTELLRKIQEEKASHGPEEQGR